MEECPIRQRCRLVEGAWSKHEFWDAERKFEIRKCVRNNFAKCFQNENSKWHAQKRCNRHVEHVIESETKEWLGRWVSDRRCNRLVVAFIDEVQGAEPQTLESFARTGGEEGLAWKVDTIAESFLATMSAHLRSGRGVPCAFLLMALDSNAEVVGQRYVRSPGSLGAGGEEWGGGQDRSGGLSRPPFDSRIADAVFEPMGTARPPAPLREVPVYQDYAGVERVLRTLTDTQAKLSHALLERDNRYAELVRRDYERVCADNARLRAEHVEVTQQSNAIALRREKREERSERDRRRHEMETDLRKLEAKLEGHKRDQLINALNGMTDSKWGSALEMFTGWMRSKAQPASNGEPDAGGGAGRTDIGATPPDEDTTPPATEKEGGAAPDISSSSAGAAASSYSASSTEQKEGERGGPTRGGEESPSSRPSPSPTASAAQTDTRTQGAAGSSSSSSPNQDRKRVLTLIQNVSDPLQHPVRQCWAGNASADEHFASMVYLAREGVQADEGLPWWELLCSLRQEEWQRLQKLAPTPLATELEHERELAGKAALGGSAPLWPHGGQSSSWAAFLRSLQVVALAKLWVKAELGSAEEAKQRAVEDQWSDLAFYGNKTDAHDRRLSALSGRLVLQRLGIDRSNLEEQAVRWKLTLAQRARWRACFLEADEVDAAIAAMKSSSPEPAPTPSPSPSDKAEAPTPSPSVAESSSPEPAPTPAPSSSPPVAPTSLRAWLVQLQPEVASHVRAVLGLSGGDEVDDPHVAHAVASLSAMEMLRLVEVLTDAERSQLQALLPVQDIGHQSADGSSADGSEEPTRSSHRPGQADHEAEVGPGDEEPPTTAATRARRRTPSTPKKKTKPKRSTAARRKKKTKAAARPHKRARASTPAPNPTATPPPTEPGELRPL